MLLWNSWQTEVYRSYLRQSVKEMVATTYPHRVKAVDQGKIGWWDRQGFRTFQAEGSEREMNSLCPERETEKMRG